MDVTKSKCTFGNWFTKYIIDLDNKREIFVYFLGAGVWYFLMELVKTVLFSNELPFKLFLINQIISIIILVVLYFLFTRQCDDD